MDNKIIIAIDGHSSTGKSTVAKQLAKILGYTYIDTGAMYRAVTWFVLKKKAITVSSIDKAKLIKLLPSIKIRFKYNSTLKLVETYVNDSNVEKEIRSLEISNLVSKVAEISEVRIKLVEQQREMGKAKGLVMDGRDIGTVVFPNAELKLFMTASSNIRAKRRFLEMKQKGDSVSFTDVLENVENRDYIDSNRKDSPLIRAKDAIVIDNSNLSIKDQFSLILDLVEQKIANSI